MCINNLYCRVQFHVEDAITMEYPINYYDAIHSRDAILHMRDKHTLFANFLKCLKPGGKLLITDYCCHAQQNEQNQEFLDYVKNYHYHLLTVQQYGQLLEDAGFSDVVALDNSKHFSTILEKELAEMSTEKGASEFRKDFSLEEYDTWCNLWKGKIKRVENGDHVWGLFTANKPS